MTTPTPQDREREAREMLLGLLWKRHPEVALDAYRTAVRAALVAEIVAGVEAQLEAAENHPDKLMPVEGARIDALNDVLDYLHGLAPERNDE